jgi:hypothetical protein
MTELRNLYGGAIQAYLPSDAIDIRYEKSNKKDSLRLMNEIYYPTNKVI